jgi:predicted MFS family arabinose efflux permease
MSQNPHAAPRLIMSLGLGMIVSFASSYYLLGVLAEPLSVATGAGTGQIFGALSAAFLLSAVCSLISGRWTDQRGGREVLSAAALMFTLALGLIAVAQTPLTAMIGVLALGLGMGFGLYAPANALLVAVYGMEARRPITLISLIGACGGAIGWPLTLWLVEMVGWRGACWVWAVAHLLVCLPLYGLCLPKDRRRVSSREDEPLKWNRPMVQLALLFAGGWWVSTACAAQLPRVMTALGLDATSAVLAAGTMAVAAIGVRILSLMVPARTSPLRLVRVACLLHPLGVAIAFLGGKPAAVVIALGQGAGNGLLSVAAGVLPLHIFGQSHYGQRQALILLPARFVQAIAPVSFGVVLNQSVGWALGLSSVVCLVMLGLSFGLGPRPLKSSVAKALDGA